MLSQICRINGASRVVLASNKGLKMDMAKQAGVADEYLELERNDAEAQWKAFKAANPYGFDAVVCLIPVTHTIECSLPPFCLSRLRPPVLQRLLMMQSI